MAILDDKDRQEQARKWARKIFVELKNVGNLNHDDIRSAASAIDDFLEAKEIQINNILPEPFKSTASADAKLYLLALVALRRSGTK